MKKLVIVSWVLKALGIVLVLLMLFGHEIVLNVFPGLEGMSINPFFYAGIVFYAAGALIYFFVNKKEKADRRRREIEESYRNAGFGDSLDIDSLDSGSDESGAETVGEISNDNSNEK